MKKILLLAAVFAYGTAAAQDTHYGEKIDSKNAISMQEMQEKLEGKESVDVKVEAEVQGVCQMKGCWMEIDAGDGETMRVKFKDYGFFVPKDCAGKTAVMRGTARVEETTVAELKHYAEDAGKSEEEIEAITEPRRQLVFVADGVILKD